MAAANMTVNAGTATVAVAPLEPCATGPTSSAASPLPACSNAASPTPSLRSTLTWKSVRSTLSVSEKTSAQLGWAVAFLSVLLTVIALSPAFRSQSVSEKSLKLAEWTALKDYIEECREELAAGIESQACIKALHIKVPPPPYVKAGVLDRTRRALAEAHHVGNSTWQEPSTEHSEIFLREATSRLLLLCIVLITCMPAVIGFVRAIVVHRSYALGSLDNEKDEIGVPCTSSSRMEEDASTSAIRHPPPSPDLNLRRRRDVRTHPIYRYANLEEAIYHDDTAEIRMRLQRGEDVNQHWPYLIYSLAITPPSVDISKRLETARLCLDFGADENVKKGWNGQSALMIAIHFGNVEVAKLLLKNGAMVSYSPPDSNLTALHRCVRLAVTGSATDALDIMVLLFRQGASPNPVDRLGETPLHKLLIDASFARHDLVCIDRLKPIALCLVEHGANIPQTLKEKHSLSNPLWDFVHNAIRVRNIERLGQTRHGRKLRRDEKIAYPTYSKERTREEETGRLSRH